MATGSTAIKLYAELVRMHRKEGLSFKKVITFNLHEYYPLESGPYKVTAGLWTGICSAMRTST